VCWKVEEVRDGRRGGRKERKRKSGGRDGTGKMVSAGTQPFCSMMDSFKVKA
jgi:hypothetical protein